MAEVGSLLDTKIIVRRVLASFVTNAFKLSQYNMQYIPCNSAFLAHEILFLTTHKKTLFLTKDFQKVRKSLQILILRQNSVFWGLKFLSESKLFGKGPSCLCTTSATLIVNIPHNHGLSAADVI